MGKKAPAHQLQNKHFKQLDQALVVALDEYFRLLKNSQPSQLHRLLLSRLEKVLFEYMLKREDYNQSKVCDILGISRSTLRARLNSYGIKLPKVKR